MKKKTKNWKDKITGKIEEKAVCLLAKTVQPPIRLFKKTMTHAKYVMDLYTPLKDAILSLAKKESG